jgi:hypothetical protein
MKRDLDDLDSRVLPDLDGRILRQRHVREAHVSLKRILRWPGNLEHRQHDIRHVRWRCTEAHVHVEERGRMTGVPTRDN